MRARLAAALVAVVALTLAPAPPVAADSEHCVSKREYRRVDDGWTRHHVRRVFDVPGLVTFHRNGVETRLYNGCEKPSALYDSKVWVQFEKVDGHWRVWFKSATWA